jgi:hypothetical protein
MVTQAELELVAREIRARGLHSSWDELLTFSKDAVGSLVDAYQALLRSTEKTDAVSSTNPDNVRKMVKGKLAKALTLLTSEARVAKWESEALMENDRPGMYGMENSDLKKISHRRNRGR